jgi:tetratricopeptide (TPR) repeat protein
MEDINDSIERLPGATKGRLLLIGSVRDFLDKLVADADPGDTALQRDLARALTKSADVQRELGELPGALEANRKALAIVSRLAEAPGGATPQALRELLVTQRNVAVIEAAQGNSAEARAGFERVVELGRRLGLVGADPERARSPDAGNADVALFTSLGDAQAALGRPEDALASFQVATELARRGDADPRMQFVLVRCRTKLGDHLLRMARPDEARAQFEQALPVLERLAEADPADTWVDRELAAVRTRLAGGTAGAGASPFSYWRIAFVARRREADGRLRSNQRVEAIESLRAAIEALQPAVELTPDDPQLLRDLFTTYQLTADTEARLPNKAAALVSQRKAVAALERLLRVEPAAPEAGAPAADAYLRLGDHLSDLQQHADALHVYEKGLAIYERLAAAQAPTVAVRRGLGLAYLKVADRKLDLALLADQEPLEALDVYGKSLAVRQALADADPDGVEANYQLQYIHYKIMWAWRRAAAIRGASDAQKLERWKKSRDSGVRALAPMERLRQAGTLPPNMRGTIPHVEQFKKDAEAAIAELEGRGVR